MAIWAGRKLKAVSAPLSNGAACTNNSSSGLHGPYSTCRGRPFSLEVCFVELEKLAHGLPQICAEPFVRDARDLNFQLAISPALGKYAVASAPLSSGWIWIREIGR